MNHSLPPRLPAFRQTHRPAAAAPITLNSSGTVTIGGVVYNYVLTETLTPVVTPPPPPPPNTSISDVTTADNVSVRSATAGQDIKILGGPFGASGTVTVAGMPAPANVWTPTGVRVTLPSNVGAPQTGPIVVSVAGGGSITSAFAFTVKPVGPLPPANQPVIRGFTDGAGNPLSGFASGTLAILGQGFGTDRGLVQKGPETRTVTAWSDTRIEVSLPYAERPIDWLTVTRADGGWDTAWLPPLGAP